MAHAGGCYIGAPAGDRAATLDAGGRWILLLPKAVIDKLWSAICNLIRAGLLGPQATVHNGPLAAAVARAGSDHAAGTAAPRVVVNVFTRDCKDEADIWRIFLMLAHHPVIRPAIEGARVYYKSEAAVRSGVYSSAALAKLFGRKRSVLPPNEKATTLYAKRDSEASKWELFRNHVPTGHGGLWHDQRRKSE